MASILSEFDEKAYAQALREEGREEGREEAFAELVRDGLLDITVAAKRAGTDVEKFKKLI